MAINENCKTCDAACCQMFGFMVTNPFKILSIGKNFWSRLYDYLFFVISTRKVKNVKVNVPWIPRRCIFLIKQKCSVYRIRPNYCRSYDCFNRPQVLHELKQREGIDIPLHFKKGEYSDAGIAKSNFSN